MKKCCIKVKLGVLCSSIHGELVTNLRWIKAPFDLQDISKGIRVRVHLSKHAVVKDLVW